MLKTISLITFVEKFSVAYFRPALERSANSMLVTRSKHSSWWRPLEDVLKTSSTFIFRKRLHQDEYVRLSLTSSEDVFKTFSRRLGQDWYIRLGHTSSRRLQDVLPKHLQDVLKTSSTTSSKRLQDVLQKRPQEIFKMFSRHLQHVLQRYLQDIFKMYHQVKLFLLTRLQ